MKKLRIITMLLIAFTVTAQSQSNANGFRKAFSLGIDPAPLFDKSAKGGLDINAKVIFGGNTLEYGLTAEYFNNIDYLSFSAFTDVIIYNQGDAYDKVFQALAGVEITFINRFNGKKLNLEPGIFMQPTAGVNGTLRWNITPQFGIEGILNFKYSPDKYTLWNETRFNKLYPISGRLNFIYYFK